MSNYQIISRKEAQSAGLNKYFSGKKCTNGHVCEKYVSNCWCVECSNNSRNTDNQKEYKKEYNKLNKEKHKQYKRTRKYREYDNLYMKNKRQTIEYKLKTNIRNRVSDILNGKLKEFSCMKNLGCTVEFLKEHIEKQFQEGMSWDNYGLHGWHIDHRFPLSKVDFSNQEEVKKATHYTNLQPLWAIDNLKKSNKVSI